MKFVFLLIISIFLRASDISVCYVSDSYKRLDTMFGHIFLAYNNRAASFNLNSNLNIKDNLSALFGVEGIMQILPKDKLIKFYEDDERQVKCYPLNLDDSQEANLSALFYEDEIYDTYTFLHKNCSSALSMYAKNYGVNLKSSLIPIRFVSLNTDYKKNFHKVGLFYEYDKKNSLDFEISILSLNDKLSHSLNILNFNKNYISPIKISEYEKISYEFELGIRYKKARVFANFFLGYYYEGFFIGANNYGLNIGILKDFDNFGIKISADKKHINLNTYFDYKNYRLSLIANQNYAKIGLIYSF